MGWLTERWDRPAWTAAALGVVVGVVLAVLGVPILAEVAASLVAAGVLWAQWQIPPPGRSRAAGTPPDAASRIARVVVAVLLVVLTADVIARAAGA